MSKNKQARQQPEAQAGAEQAATPKTEEQSRRFVNMSLMNPEDDDGDVAVRPGTRALPPGMKAQPPLATIYGKRVNGG